MTETPYRVVVTGHRDALHTRPVLQTILKGIQARRTPLEAITGMALGVDLDFADAALDLGIPVVAALPVVDHCARWHGDAQERHARVLQQATRVIQVWKQPGYICTGYAAQMFARNRWMVDQIQQGLLIAVWDGRLRGGTYNCMKEAQKRGVKILRVDPQTMQVGVVLLVSEVEHKRGMVVPKTLMEVPDDKHSDICTI